MLSPRQRGKTTRCEFKPSDRSNSKRPPAGSAAVGNVALPPCKSIAITVQANEQGGVLTLRWDPAQHPYLTVTHVGRARTVIAMDLQGGSATLPTAALPAGGRFEFDLSDGLNSQRVVLPR